MKEINLVIDAGNTRIKYAFFEGRLLKECCYAGEQLVADTRKWKNAGYRLEIFLSGSGVLPEGPRQELQALADGFREASPEMELPVKIGYATPETLGFDRIAICAGAMSLYPRMPLLVIDSGTAITFNYVNEEGVFLGGNISPGLDMRFKSLHRYTARLPYVQAAEIYGGIGRTTETAIRNGVMDGMLFEVEHYIGRFLDEHTGGRVVVTGGNSRFLKNVSGDRILFSTELGFIGLNEILRFTKKD